MATVRSGIGDQVTDGSSEGLWMGSGVRSSTRTILLCSDWICRQTSAAGSPIPLPTDSTETGSEIYVHKSSFCRRSRDLYQAPISYAAKPKADKRDWLYVRAEVSERRLGISSIHLPCEVIRDYFYVSTRGQRWEHLTSLYEVLRITSAASLAELRVAFRLRQLELCAAGASNHDRAPLERAFNILAQPELRACY
ncbi:MAG TPA: hypothetical protein VEO19_03110, partial [Terriglobia bacterium]|nr:hypothetical protein [Terriglobia bacterium]